jgi:cytochrome P450
MDAPVTATVDFEVDDIDFSDHEGFWSRPLSERHAAYAHLRATAPVTFHPEPATDRFREGPGFWALVRHADVLEASRAPELFSSASGTSIRDLPVEFNEFFGSMLNMDVPRHARLRRLVSAGFTPRTMARIEADLAAIATARVDRLLDEGPCDFVDVVAAPLPLSAICMMMGIPPEHHDLVRRQSDIILDPGSTPVGVPRSQAVLDAGRTLAGLIDEVAARRSGGDDLTTGLLQAEVDGERLTRQEIQSFFVLLTAAGNETTRNASTWGLRLLTEHPEQRAQWMADLDGVAATAVEEIVRYATPVIQFRRTVTRDGVQLAGRTFNEGDKVVLFYESANRDRAAFDDDPDRFVVTRDPNPHVGFGGPGPHFCLGAHLARRQLVVLFKELLRRVPTIVADGPPERIVSSLLNGVRRQACSW